MFEFRLFSNKMTLHALVIALNYDEVINTKTSTLKKKKVSVPYVTTIQ